MKKINPFCFCSAMIFFILISGKNMYSQDTFSICAVDIATGQVGSAGATCIANASTSAIIISDVHPGTGVIHTQASYIAMNQSIARGFMNQGLTPQQIIDSMIANDFQNNPSVRQYGIVSLDSGGLSAAYTGQNCLFYKNHITGPGYSIQGNILLGPQILDSMEARFLNTTGSLACRLMAALQGANVVGADTRCTNYGISSYSAFIRVANPSDSAGQLYLDLTVNTFPGNKEPIDSLQKLLDLALTCINSGINTADEGRFKIFPNPATHYVNITSDDPIEFIRIINTSGIIMERYNLENNAPISVNLSDFDPGIYFLLVHFNNSIRATKLVISP